MKEGDDILIGPIRVMNLVSSAANQNVPLRQLERHRGVIIFFPVVFGSLIETYQRPEADCPEVLVPNLQHAVQSRHLIGHKGGKMKSTERRLKR